MTDVVVQRKPHHSSPPQPLDRHLSEIDELDGTIYINAGIDSTCCRKRSQTVHKLTNGIIVSKTKETGNNRWYSTFIQLRDAMRKQFNYQ